MNKKKLKTEDGSEFTVFYLSDQKSQITDTPIEGFTGWLGTQEIESYKETAEQDFGAHKLIPLKTVWQSGDETYQISIDDTIESDLVKEPVVGRIYKVKSLGGVIARLKETYVGDENLNPDTVYARMDLHGTEFVVAVEDLRKATEFEVEKYLKKNVD